MCITEFDEEKYKRTIAEVSWEEGMEKGKTEGRLDAFREIREKLVRSGMSPVTIDAILSGQ